MSDYDRRTFVTVGGTAALAALAGCSGGDGGSEATETGSAERTAGGGGGPTASGETLSYAWTDATWDSYWYSLYNMSTNIAMSGNGVVFPSTDKQKRMFEKRFPAMLEAADQERPPVKNPNLNMLPFTAGDPSFTEQPVLSGEDGRPDAATLAWDRSKSSGVVSPASVAWTHTKGVTWAKNFENHFDLLPESLAAEFRSEVLATLAQLGIKASLIDGGPDGNGLLTKGERMELVSGVDPAAGEAVDATARPTQHAAMLWFLADMTSLAQGGWFGYENPEPLLPAGKVQKLTDGLGRTTMELFSPDDVVSTGSTRDLGPMLSAVAWYGTHAGSDELASRAAAHAGDLADAVESSLDGNGRVEDGAANQAATQGAVAQGLTWASELDGVDRTGAAGEVVGYMLDELWDDDAGTFASGTDDATYAVTARDAGDVTGGINAADAVLGMDVRETYARYVDNTFNRGRLQRAERPPSRSESAEHTLPLPPKAGGEYGQAAVYNAAVEYDTDADEWSVTDRTFRTAGALYLANQDIWIGQWGGEFYEGRGLPGRTDTPA